MKIRKRFLSAILVLCIFFSMALSAFATESTFVINGVTVSPSSGVSLKNCSAYASQVLKKIWNYKGVTTTFNSSYNMLKDKTSSEREITEDHVREFIQNAPLGSRIRISHYSDTSTDNYDNNINGHTMVLVAKDDNAGTFTTLEAGGGSAEANSYSYSSFTQYWRNFKNRNGVVGYCYFFYIADLTSFGTSIPQCTITFDPTDGTVSPSTKTVVQGGTLDTLPIPTRPGYTFTCWSTAKEGSGSALTADNYKWMTFDSDTTLYAKWNPNCTNHTYEAERCTNCGATIPYDNKFDSSVAGIYRVTEKTAYIRTGPYQSKDLVRTISEGETINVSGSVINSYGNTWLKTSDGYYVHADRLTYDEGQAQSYYVILDDGSVCNRIKVTNGGTYGNLPTPTKDGYTFDGWFTSVHGGNQVTSTTTVNLTGDQTLYAHWTRNPDSYTVTFDANGGSVSQTSMSVTVGSVYGTLPTPTRSGYKFDGWYTSVNGSIRMTSNTIVEPSHYTLYAHWTMDGSYFNCNVGIYCVYGKTVNLYNNPGDSNRVDYFSLGQSVGSTYGVNMPDGSTWYQVSVTSKGNVITVWLKYESDKMTVKSISDSAPDNSTPQYFSCNVGIFTVKGKTVNLYNNPGDSKRVDYFDLGQSVGSSYGVNMPDGTTWYQVSVTSKGNVITVWLKYESDKMTIKNL